MPKNAVMSESKGQNIVRPIKRIPIDELPELPEILTATEVVSYLRGIFGRNAVYDLLREQAIRNRRHGQKFLIPKAALRDFIECRSEHCGAGTPR